MTARVQQNADFGAILDAGSVVMEPASFAAWPEGVILRVESPLFAGPGLDLRSEHPVLREWRVRDIYLRQWDVVPEVDPNSYRPDLSSVRLRQIERNADLER